MTPTHTIPSNTLHRSMDDGSDGCSSDFDPSPPPRVSIPSPFPVHRLSGSLAGPRRPVPPRRPVWVSLQGRLVGAEEASSARAVGLGGEEGVAWECLFSPLQRVLIVAVVAAAAAESKKRREVEKLRRSVELREQLLRGMQQKLDDLCEHIFPVEDFHEHKISSCFNANDLYMEEERESKGKRLSSCCSESDSFDMNLSIGLQDEDGLKSCHNEMFKDEHLNSAVPEERRMSDLSDLCPSVTSSVDVELSVLAAEQEFYNIQKECEEKDAIINELLAAAHASKVAESKRISELEDIIKRKNLVISKLRKDITFLEQKVIELTRLRRSSYTTTPNLKLESFDLPVMSSNILYDMSSSSPSSSDSDVPKKKIGDLLQCPVALMDQPLEDGHTTTVENQRSPSSRLHRHKSRVRLSKQHSVSPIKESQTLQLGDEAISTRPKNLLVSSAGVSKKVRRPNHQEKKSFSSQRRWL